MGKFIVLTFLILGWTFYEMSGGSDFVPEVREVAQADTAVRSATPAVTRAATTPTLISLNLPTRDVAAEPEVIAEVIAPVVPVSLTEDAQVVDAVQTAAPTADLRSVDATRVNMRAGPGTNFDVVDAFDRGTQAEVLLVDATGWARIRIVETGQTGWMAERLLTNG